MAFQINYGYRNVVKDSAEEAFEVAAQFAGVSARTIRNRYCDGYSKDVAVVVGGKRSLRVSIFERNEA